MQPASPAPSGPIIVPKATTPAAPIAINLSGLKLNTQTTSQKSGLQNVTTGKAIMTETPINLPPQSTTTLTSNKAPDIIANTNKLNTLSTKGAQTTSTGQYVSATGSAIEPSGYNDIRDSNGLLVNPPGAKYDRNTGWPLVNGVPQDPSKAAIGTPTATKTGAGTTAPEYEKTVEADTSEEEAAANKIMEDMKKSLDASTLGMVEAIQQKFAVRKAEQADINMRQTKGMKNALLMGGVTGQGSRAQYAPISSEGIIGAQESYGLRQLAQLDAEETQLIAEAKAAQEAGNFKFMETALKQIETKRQEKLAAASELNKGITERNNAMREENKLVERDTAIADAYSGGATDVPSIMAKLKASGMSVSSKDIAETLKNMVPPGLDDLVKTLRTNGAPADVIQKVLSSQNINDAYKNAGSYAAGGTGDIGEYNLYKAQAEFKGQSPLDYLSFLKAKTSATTKATGGGGGVEGDAQLYAGLSSPTATAVRAKVTKFGTEPQVTNFSTIQDGYNFASSLSDTTINPADDQALIYALAKTLDPGSVVREGEYATAQKYAQSWAKAYGKKVTQALAGTGFLSEEARSNIKKTIEQKYLSTKKTYDNLFDQYTKGINNLTGRNDGSVFLIDYANQQDVGSNLIQEEDQAEQALIQYGKDNPDVRAEIEMLLTQDDPDLGRPLTYAEVAQIYQP